MTTAGHRRRTSVMLALLGSGAMFVAAPVSSSPSGAPASEPPVVQMEAPRIRSMLEHAWAAESGSGQQRNAHLAAYLYCQAARSGSAEGHYRAGRLLAAAAAEDEHRAAAFFFATAVELGHGRAVGALDELVRQGGPAKLAEPGCFRGEPYHPPPTAIARAEEPARAGEAQAKTTSLFDLDAYVATLKPERQRVAALVSRYARDFGIDRRLALAIASVESNFDPMARSPKNARGVMQLIPETAKRFKVGNPYDAVESIRGGLAYLRWLSDYFAGDLVRVIAAYNAGEGAVTRHDGIPPYDETRIYVRRVIELAGIPARRPVRTTQD